MAAVAQSKPVVLKAWSADPYGSARLVFSLARRKNAVLNVLIFYKNLCIQKNSTKQCVSRRIVQNNVYPEE